VYIYSISMLLFIVCTFCICSVYRTDVSSSAYPTIIRW